MQQNLCGAAQNDHGHCCADAQVTRISLFGPARGESHVRDCSQQLLQSWEEPVLQ